ncbi:MULTISPECIES: acyltransferase [unclassified Symbiopectobacterium]|uniref:acyltransferase n=1 Tax=unclassified Symbiopectobacterium TaxID=2794573 RepID=UPI0022273122|nr:MULTISPECIES: acyltransferase [unclassified Symbiopectobacterium]MCW2473049.1 acyltransferase [Candidatus Symbiopectobacterium sp. NZEC151]MCW2481848.1 acyltransferase [Candidatus Symbiopectobacterium sp. NZEC135]
MYSLAMPACGKNFQVSANVIIKGLDLLSVGCDVYIAPNVVINCHAQVILQDQVMIGFNSVVVSGNHTYLNGSFRFGISSPSLIQIGFGSWIAANCTICAGVKIGSGCLIAANSVVNRNCDGGFIYAGVPARKIKSCI